MKWEKKLLGIVLLLSFRSRTEQLLNESIQRAAEIKKLEKEIQSFENQQESPALDKQLKSDFKELINLEIDETNSKWSSWTELVTRPASYIWGKAADTFDYFKDLVKIGVDSTRNLNAAISLYRDSYIDRAKYADLLKEYNAAPDFQGSKATEALNLYSERLFQDVKVHTDDSLDAGELKFITKRLEHVKVTVKKMFGLQDDTQLKKVPKIAICSSGGGFRAMMATAGLYKAFETELENYYNARLIDTVMWATVLSGSTWVTAPRAMGKSTDSLIDGYKKYANLSLSGNSLTEIKSIGFNEKHKEIAQNNILRKFYFDQPIDAMDLYGALIMQMAGGPFDTGSDTKNPYQDYVKQDRQRVLYSQALDYLEADECSTFPLPLATAVSPLHGWWNPGQQNATKSKMQWFAFSPYILESYYFTKERNVRGSHIPIWAVGRRFEAEYDKGGKTFWSSFFGGVGDIKEVKSKKEPQAKEYASELPLGNFMATWGSAFAVSPKDVIRLFVGENAITHPITTMDHLFSLMATVFAPLTSLTGSLRLFPSTIHNFTKELQDTTHSERSLTFVDAGIDFNLPFPPLLWRDSRGKPLRDADLIFVLDSSAPVIQKTKKYKNWYSWEQEEVEEVAELIKAEKWAKAQGIPFPQVKASDAHEKVIGKDENGHAIYSVTVFPSRDGSPTIIYIPLLDNDISKKNNFNVAACAAADCATFNFKYSDDNIDGLVNHVKETVLDNMDLIMKEIEKVAVAA